MMSMALFQVQAAFSAAGLGFAFFMLYNGASASVYLPVATGIIAAWLPSPIRPPSTEKPRLDPGLHVMDA